MSDSRPEPDQPEILGSLPRTRPGRRSPRRDEAARARERQARRAAATEARTSGDEPTDGRFEPPRTGDAPGAADAVVGVARTGAAVATGAVGLGLRAAGGALRAIRGTVDRR